MTVLTIEATVKSLSEFYIIFTCFFSVRIEGLSVLVTTQLLREQIIILIGICLDTGANQHSLLLNLAIFLCGRVGIIGHMIFAFHGWDL